MSYAIKHSKTQHHDRGLARLAKLQKMHYMTFRIVNPHTGSIQSSWMEMHTAFMLLDLCDTSLLADQGAAVRDCRPCHAR